MRHSEILFLFIVSIAPFGCSSANYGKWIEQLTTYQDSVKIVSTQVETKHLDSATFSLKEYMSIYSDLRVRDGYTIEYLDDYGFEGGRPLLYGRSITINFDSLLNENIKWNDQRYDSVLEIRRKRVELKNLEEEKERYIRYEEMINQYLRWDNDEALRYYARDTLNAAYLFLDPLDSRMGYFQLLMFYIVGDNFGYFWHAWYRYHYVIYKREQIEELIRQNEREDFNVCLEAEKARELLSVDLRPLVVFEGECCLITIYTFYAVNGGIYKTTWSIERHYPYRITMKNKVRLVKNDVRGFY